MTEFAPYSVLVLSVFMLVGGIIGFKKAKSKASLISGVVSAILLGICFAMCMTQAGGSAYMGLMAAFSFTFALDAVFAIRLSKTKKFMPAGMLLVVIAITQVVLAVALFVQPNATVNAPSASTSGAAPDAATTSGSIPSTSTTTAP